MKPRIAVVGSYVQDLSFACERLPQPGETVVARFVDGPGGKGSNQAVAASRAGVPAVFVGAVGRDLFARAARDFYRAEGIAARFVEKPGRATGVASILVDGEARNLIAVALGANALLRPADVPARLLAGARVVLCQHEANYAVNAHAFRLARRGGALRVLNPAPMRADFDPASLEQVDVLIPNETEFAALANRVPALRGLLRRRPFAGAGRFDERALHALSGGELQLLCRALGVPVVIVTLGGRGCFVSQAGGFEFIAAHRVRAVDTTGAGDAFIGGFAAGLVRFDGDVARSARFGNAVAALAVTRIGTAPAMPRAAEVERFLRSRR